MNYSLSKIAEITGGSLTGKKELEVRNILTDSRSPSVSTVSLFFAIIGPNHDGHRYVTELYERGVKGFVISAMDKEFKSLNEAGFIIVQDTMAALQKLARYHREQFSGETIAITGSNGKTIVKEWLYHCLQPQFTITRSPKSYNSQLGVPLSLLLLDDHTTLGIFEAGISIPGEMNKLREMILPGIGIFTNIGEAHQENFTSAQTKIREKLKLFFTCHTLIYCADHQLIKNCIDQMPELSGIKLFTWSVTGKADVQIAGINKQADKTIFKAFYNNNTIEVCIPFTDEASVENAMHCLATLLLLNTDPAVICRQMADLPPVAMRLEQKSAINGCTLINDSYNSDINSLSIALDVLNRQVQHQKKTLIISDILQSGKREYELYGIVSALSREKGISRIIGVGPSICENSGAFTLPGSFYATTAGFIEQFNEDDFLNEAILLKGSRKFEFEKIAALLEQKTHTTRVEINLSSLVHNLNFFRSKLKPGTKTMVMVKALSYGSGRHEIANILQFQRTDYLGVAITDEGISLRDAGIQLPIMVMNPEPHSFDLMIQQQLEPEIYSIQMMDLFHKAVLRNQEVDFPVHIKIDSGMHRMGFLPDEIPQLCKKLPSFRNIRVASVFSHLAGSDEEQFDEFTNEQIAIFSDLSEQISKVLGYPVIRHILNTSGIERFPDAQFEMVRLGIGLYGISTEHPEKLANVNTLKSVILQIKKVKPGESVGYSRKGKPVVPSVIAVIPVGYADGLNRKLSNGNGYFLVKGKNAPIIGNICMDMTMIDITGIDAVVGDEVVIMGDGIPISSIARKLDTIPYEILTGISDRVKRVYIHE